MVRKNSEIIREAHERLAQDVGLNKDWHSSDEELLSALYIAYKDLRGLEQLVFDRIRSRFERGSLAGVRLNPITFNILRVLNDYSPRWQVHIERFLVFRIQKAHLSSLVSQLEEDDLLERQPAEDDARALEVRITTLGKRVVREAEKEYHEVLPVLFDGFKNEQRDQFLQLLHAFKCNVRRLACE